MLSAKKIFEQINKLTIDLIRTGLCDDQNFPVLSSLSANEAEVTIGKINTTIFLKNVSYSDMYATLVSLRAFNFSMIDGALLLLQYKFCGNEIISHRLSFFPSPDLYEFQNEPELYLEDQIYADVVDKRVVPFPIRFDYEVDSQIVKPIEHPVSHLTLGQYKNCRIPVNSAVTPYQFIYFIITNFYHTAYVKYSDELSEFRDCFDESIFKEEKELVHIHLPVYSHII